MTLETKAQHKQIADSVFARHGLGKSLGVVITELQIRGYTPAMIFDQLDRYIREAQERLTDDSE